MPENRTSAPAALAALGSVAAMLGCCLPLPAVLAAGALGTAAGWLPAARPYLLALALGSLAYAFYRLYHRRYCERRRPLWLQAAVWLALIAVGVTAAFPEWLANRLAGPVAAPRASGPRAALVTLRDVSSLRDAFNAAPGHTRLIALLSPT